MPRKTADEAARTREAILDAALAVFAERGYASSQLEEIAGRASVTRGAVYHHFSDKAELFLAVVRERWSSALSPVLAQLEIPRRSARARVRAFVRAFIDAMNDDPTARALMKLTLSGDMSLPAFAPHVHEKVDAWASWQDRIEGALSSEGSAIAVGVRARALVIALIGYAVEVSVRGADEPPAREALASVFTDAVVPRGATARRPRS